MMSCDVILYHMISVMSSCEIREYYKSGQIQPQYKSCSLLLTALLKSIQLLMLHTGLPTERGNWGICLGPHSAGGLKKIHIL